MAFVMAARNCEAALARLAKRPVEVAKTAQYMGRCYTRISNETGIFDLFQSRLQGAAKEVARVAEKKSSYLLGGVEHPVKDSTLCKKSIDLKVQAALDKDDLKGIFVYIATIGGRLPATARGELYGYFVQHLEKQVQLLPDLREKIEEEVRRCEESDGGYSSKELYGFIEERLLNKRKEPQEECADGGDIGPVADPFDDGSVFF